MKEGGQVCSNGNCLDPQAGTCVALACKWNWGGWAPDSPHPGPLPKEREEVKRLREGEEVIRLRGREEVIRLREREQVIRLRKREQASRLRSARGQILC